MDMGMYIGISASLRWFLRWFIGEERYRHIVHMESYAIHVWLTGETGFIGSSYPCFPSVFRTFYMVFHLKTKTPEQMDEMPAVL